jgi:hypothetical protein
VRGQGQRFDPTNLLIGLCWAVVVIPRLVQTFTAPKYRTSVGAPVPYSRLSDQTERGLGVLLLFLCLYIVLRNARDLPSDRRGVLACLIAPWVFMVSRDLYLTGRPHVDGIIYPYLIIAVWVLRPRIERLSLLGYLVGATALLSVLMGALIPAKGAFAAYTGQLIAPEKQILPWGVLVGPFTDSNNLGQFLVLGLPAVAFVRGRAMRALIAAITVFAIIWTSSRSSITAVVVGALVSLLLGLLLPANRRFPSRLILLISTAALVIIPVTARSDEAFTNRGYIWKMSLEEWHTNIFLGHGSAWYASVAKYANSLGGNAFHGHNQFVQTVVVGGVCYLVLTTVMLAVLIHAAGNWAARAVDYPAIFLAMFLTSCTLEVSFGVVDRSFLIAVTVLPMAFLALADRSGGPVLRVRHPTRTQPRTRVQLIS